MLTSRFLRRIATLIALLSFLLILTGCFLISGSGDVIPEDAPSDSTENTDKEPQETEPERITDGVLIDSAKNDHGFVIVCKKSSNLSLNRALDVRYLIKEHTGASLEVVDHTDKSHTFEIIVTEAPREISDSLKNSVLSYAGEEDFRWGFAFNGTQLAIFATNDYAWQKCIEEFAKLYFSEGKLMVTDNETLHLSCVTRADYELERKRKDTHLDPVFKSHAVLQRDRYVTLHGTGIGHVSVEFLGETYEGVTDGEEFFVTLPPTPAGGPYTITVNIEGEITVLEDILFGDVIILAGQSNAELTLDQTDYSAEEYISNNRVRTYFVGQHFSDEFTFKSILDNRWATLTESEAAKWPAIAYHLGNMIEGEHDVPVGIICVVRGASVIQSFMSTEAQAEFNFAPEELSVEHPCNTSVDRYRFYNNQGVIYETMFSKIKHYTVSSVVWYQGESNIGSGESKVYDELLLAMINEWRADLGDESLPFFIVKIHDRNSNAGWLAVREAQERAANNITNCYLVNLDPLGVCTDIHPKNKQAVSELIYQTYREVFYS